MPPLAGNEKFRVRGRVRGRGRSKNENDSGGPRERKPRPRRGSFLVARNRSSIVLVLVLVLVLVSAIGCKGEDVGVPKSNKLALMGLKPWAESYSPFVGARDRSKFLLILAPFLTDPFCSQNRLRPPWSHQRTTAAPFSEKFWQRCLRVEYSFKTIESSHE
jgi:hypothetical protein